MKHPGFSDSEWDDQPERAADLIADALLAVVVALLAGITVYFCVPLFFMALALWRGSP